jgi:hypothetical protein
MTFNEWLNEIENYGTRHERFLEEWDNGMDDKRMMQWLKAAYQMGLEHNQQNKLIDSDLLEEVIKDILMQRFYKEFRNLIIFGAPVEIAEVYAEYVKRKNK